MTGINSDGRGQTSIDFLTGMTLFILTVVFAFQFMFGMVQPYSSTAEESTRISDRVSDRLYTDILSSPNGSPGELSYGSVSSFFENRSESEIREVLGLSKTDRFNITLSSDYTSYGVRDNLVAYWPMNERRSEEATDIANEPGERLNGDIQGNVTVGVRGISSSGAYRFDGDDAAVRVDGEALIATDSRKMTFSAWVKPEGSQPADYSTIVAKGSNTGYQMHLENDGATRNPVFEGGDYGDPPEAQWNTPLEVDRWHHVVGVYENSSATSDNTFRLYVNGELKKETTTSRSIANAPGDNFGIGNNLNNADRHFNGVIDEVRVYDTALSPDEVTDLYTAAGVLSPDAPDRSTNSPLKNVSYRLGDKAPSGQDIASVSTRKRVGYISFGGDGSGDGGGGGGNVGNRNRIEFTAISSNSQNSIRIEYGTGSGVDTGVIEEACLEAPNGDGSIDSNQAPCPGTITIGIDGDGDGRIDSGRDASDDIECCPNPSNGDDGVIPKNSNTTIRIETSGNYNLNNGETLIVEYPKVHEGCMDVTANANGDGFETVRSCATGSGSSSGTGPDTGAVEVTVRVW